MVTYSFSIDEFFVVIVYDSNNNIINRVGPFESFDTGFEWGDMYVSALNNGTVELPEEQPIESTHS